MNNVMKKPRIIRLKEVLAKTGLSISSLRRLQSKKQFPNKFQISPRCVGWLEEDVDDWIRLLTMGR